MPLVLLLCPIAAHMMQNITKGSGQHRMCQGIYGILIRQHSDFFQKNRDSVLKSIRVLPLDVFYISLLSEKYKGSALSFLKGILKGVKFAFLSVFNNRRSSSVIYILRKRYPLITVEPAVSS